MAPILQIFCLSVFVVARSQRVNTRSDYTVSVVVPARNEAGNVQAAVDRLPGLGRNLELIFIEGHSRDNTWDEIQRVAREHPEVCIRTMPQTGKGKGNAVREAFEAATGDIVMILDADLTMPPEELPRYYEAVASGKADFANGVRLVYPMNDEANRLLNLYLHRMGLMGRGDFTPPYR